MAERGAGKREALTAGEVQHPGSPVFGSIYLSWRWCQRDHGYDLVLEKILSLVQGLSQGRREGGGKEGKISFPKTDLFPKQTANQSKRVVLCGTKSGNNSPGVGGS
jgi:hypothetical protein